MREMFFPHELNLTYASTQLPCSTLASRWRQLWGQPSHLVRLALPVPPPEVPSHLNSSMTAHPVKEGAVGSV